MFKWIDREIKYLEDNHKNLSIRHIAKALNKSKGCITRKLVKLGLHEVKPYLKNVRSENLLILTADERYKRVVLLKMLANSKTVAIECNKKTNVDLSQVVESYRLRMG